VPNISRGRVATHWFLTREERKKEAPQEGLAPPCSKEMRDCRPWQHYEDHRVRVAYKKLGSRALAAELGRNYRTVQNRARVLGVSERRP
jgi:hypothetical protein